MSKDVGVISPVGAPAWLNPVIKDLKAGLRTKQDEGDDLNAIEAVTGSGVLVRTGDNTWALRTLTAPAAGITITNPAGTAGNFVFALANDLAGVEGLSTTGLAVRSAADTWITRAVAGTANEITVTNGDGIAGAPTLSLPAALTFTGKTVTGGTFTTLASVSIDDGQFMLDIVSSNPTFNVDSNDLFRYVRSTNTYEFRIASATIFSIAAAGCTIGDTVASDAHTVNGTLTVEGPQAVGQTQVICKGATGGYGAGISLSSNRTGGAILSMVEIVADATSTWTTTASTQDAKLSIKVRTDGTLNTLCEISGASISFIGNLNTDSNCNINGVYEVDGTQVMTNRRTGWGTPSGTADRATFDTATITLEELAQRVKALIDDGLAHGFIGA